MVRDRMLILNRWWEVECRFRTDVHCWDWEQMYEDFQIFPDQLVYGGPNSLFGYLWIKLRLPSAANEMYSRGQLISRRCFVIKALCIRENDELADFQFSRESITLDRGLLALKSVSNLLTLCRDFDLFFWEMNFSVLRACSVRMSDFGRVSSSAVMLFDLNIGNSLGFKRRRFTWI